MQNAYRMSLVVTYQRVKPHKKMIAPDDTERIPVATLSDKVGGLVHIVVEDDCYVCYIYSPELNGFTMTPYIFPELREALCALPPL